MTEYATVCLNANYTDCYCFQERTLLTSKTKNKNKPKREAENQRGNQELKQPGGLVLNHHMVTKTRIQNLERWELKTELQKARTLGQRADRGKNRTFLSTGQRVNNIGSEGHKVSITTCQLYHV